MRSVVQDSLSFIQHSESSAKKSSSFGLKIPDFDLYYKRKGLFAVKMLTLEKASERDYNLVENTIAIKEGRVVWVSKLKDSALEKALKQNLSVISKPETFVLQVVDDYSEEIIDFLGDAENNFSIVEDLILKYKTRKVMEKIFYLKRKLMRIRQANRKYLRLVSYFSRENKKLYNESIALYEKLLHIDELIGNYNDLLSNLIDAHLSVISNKLNQVMKVLAIIATTALPLTVISSMYGMNIKLPFQLHENAFLLVISIMLVTIATMVILFTRLGWFKESS